MSSDFDAKRQLTSVLWLPTLQLNGLRAVSAGFVIAVISLFMETPGTAGTARLTAAATVLLSFPLCYLLFLLPLGLILSMLSRVGVPFTGILAAFFSLLVVLGDPLLFIAGRLRAGLLPVDDFSFMNWRLVIMVTQPDDHDLALATG